MAKKNGASLLVDCLEAHEVKYIFGVPGASVMPILDVLRDKGPAFVVCRHEQNAAFMAQAWGRLRGEAGVCMATVGPGATNLVTGVATATADRDPLVAIAGQTPRSEQWQTRHQNIDEARMFDPITKMSLQVNAAEAIPEIIASAFRTAETPRQGSAFLAFPKDVLDAAVSAKPVVRSICDHAGDADEEEIERASALVLRAKRPVLLVGVGASDKRSTRAVRAFMETTGIPAVGTFEAAGVVGKSLVDQFLGRVGLAIEEPGDAALHDADLVITVGYDAVEYAPSMWAGRARIIHINRLAAEVDAAYDPSSELVGDISHTLHRLQKAIGEKRWKLSARAERARQKLVAEQRQGTAMSGTHIHPARIVAELRKALGDHDLLISDVGAHQLWLAREFFTFQPRTLLFSMGFQTMGVALPWAIGARLAEPHRKIISCSGDGSFLMSAMELETAVRLKLPFVHCVWRDGTYNLVEIQQIAQYGRTSGTAFGNPDIVAFAKSFGATGLRVNHASGLASAFSRALKVRGPVIIDIPVDYRYNAGLLGKGGLFGGRSVD